MKLEVIVEAPRDIAEGIREFTFRSRDGGKLPTWQAGAHVQVLLPIASGGGRRAYSLIGDPRDRAAYRIAVQYESKGQGGSRFLHERIAAGDRMVISAPMNAFELTSPQGRRVELVAGGIGVTPLIAMTRVLMRRKADFRLSIFARDRARIPFMREIDAAIGARAQFVVSDDVAVNAARLDAIAADAAARAADIYVCGPAGFVTAMQNAAQAAGLGANHVRLERFVTPASDAAGRPFRIRLARSGVICEVPARRSALDVIEETLGAPVPYDCRVGYCGTCAQTVLAGEPEHRDTALGPRDHAEGRICVCVSRSAGEELTIDL